MDNAKDERRRLSEVARRRSESACSIATAEWMSDTVKCRGFKSPSLIQETNEVRFIIYPHPFVPVAAACMRAESCIHPLMEGSHKITPFFLIPRPYFSCLIIRLFFYPFLSRFRVTECSEHTIIRPEFLLPTTS